MPERSGGTCVCVVGHPHVGRAALLRELGGDRAAVAPSSFGDGVAVGLDREAGGLEEHHHEREVLGVARVRVALDALLGGLVDAVDLVE